MDGNYQHFVGIDWASVEHEVCAMNSLGKQLDARSFKHSGDGLAELCAWLRKLGDPEARGLLRPHRLRHRQRHLGGAVVRRRAAADGAATRHGVDPGDRRRMKRGSPKHCGYASPG
jgi:hypothetical protein